MHWDGNGIKILTHMSNSNAKPILYWVYVAVFTFSGFSGLIYESIWTRYLKLFLGSAAFAQALTLAIFMGGMAVGAWGAARLGRKSANLLLWYALVELVVGVAAMVFHLVFTISTQLAYDWLFPAVGFSSFAVGMVKWSLAALLILPQSILLGATFPLMTAGVVRRFPQAPGLSLATFYFVNSLGGAAGVLLSGFYLIDSFGLPGTVMIAGLTNLALAAMVIAISAGHGRPMAPAPNDDETAANKVAWITWRILLCAGLTGVASFLYEIGWIRMLSLVLGSSTRSFELMLSAFILGLALGGYLIRRRIEALENHLFTLAEIQVAMGALALITIHIYGGSFTAMAALIKALAKTSEGYILFNLSSHAIALAIMLPATIMAGMTLPLMTHFLLLRGEGEASIGKVYAANTIGAIIGVALGSLFIMPLLGLKYVILAGAVIDIALGFWLFLLSGKEGAEKNLAAVAAFGLAAVATTILFARMDHLKMASGVYRTGKMLDASYLVPYHKDGRTASVDFIMAQTRDPFQVISTNGKPDSSIGLYTASTDEPVMILLTALGWDINPVEGTAAVVGIGTGLSSHVALSIPSIKRVDTVEIEPAMVEGARLFRDRVAKVFNDPKSRIHIDDAKSFFASRANQYDLISSEPSNPWVAGVAGLFSTQFYSLARRNLADGGVLVQWVQLYEIEPEQVAGIIKAVSANFEDYTLYVASNGDLMIIARKGLAVPEPSGKIFSTPELAENLERIGVSSLYDLSLRRIGGKKSMDPFFQNYGADINSDYYPTLDSGATRARYLGSNSRIFEEFRSYPVPVVETLEGRAPQESGAVAGENFHYDIGAMARGAKIMRHVFLDPKASTAGMDRKSIRALMGLRSVITGPCPTGPGIKVWLEDAGKVFSQVTPYSSPEEMAEFWGHVTSSACFGSLPENAQNWIRLHKAVGMRDFATAQALADSFLPRDDIRASNTNDYLVSVAMLARIKAGKKEEAAAIWKRYHPGKKKTPILWLLAAWTKDNATP